jgi:hypothetical protein
MPRIAEKPGFQMEAVLEVRKDNESVPVYQVGLRCLLSCAAKSCTNDRKQLTFLGGFANVLQSESVVMLLRHVDGQYEIED